MRYTPPPGSSDPNAPYITGVPGLVQGTPVPGEAVEHPQREIVAAIAAAGLIPSAGELDQLSKAIMKLIQEGMSLTQEDFHQFRKRFLCVPQYWRSTTLPPNSMWGNGDLVTFSDWPEVMELYNGGGFSGMLLPYNASSETIAANIGMWRPNAASPTGLFAPNFGDQFFRNWVNGLSKGAGAWGRDEIRNITGGIGYLHSSSAHSGNSGQASAIYWGTLTGFSRPSQMSNTDAAGGLGFNAGNMVNTGPQNVPQHVYQPIILYLGRPAEV
ncbi:MAG: hypothetical protein LBQ51_05620 [Desulfovibrio sp.]|jgi:hypothetical protein|nr:hypothetical protein [Desulfovibrio sp.]